MSASFRGFCPEPFLQEDLFPSSGGFVNGRLCKTSSTELGDVVCCLPCPATDWTYSDGFIERTTVANWVNVAALIATLFVLLSFACLHSKWTHVHYLSICLVIAVAFIEFAFIVPLLSQPDQCFNEITPNDMKSSISCAFSGAFILFGGWAAVLWVFWRALSLHLQICWEVVPGKAFFYTSLVLGWGIPAIGLTVALILTGVSFRFGNVCHINHQWGLQDFWGPLLAFAAAALIIQFITFGYCIQVYVRSLLHDDPVTETESGLPSYSGSGPTRGRRHAFKRVKQVIRLQWRAVTVVLLIIAEIIFFAVVFVRMDNNMTVQESGSEQVQPWLKCLRDSGGDRDQCLSLVQDLVESEATVLTLLIFLALSGFWLFFLLGRWSMILGWVDLIKRWTTRRRNGVFGSDLQVPGDPAGYDVLGSSASRPDDLKSPEAVVTCVSPGRPRVQSPELVSRFDYLGREARYKSPEASFSSPRPPSANGVQHREPPVPVSPIGSLDEENEKNV